jgi:methionyl aminopeptidase
VFSGRSRIEIKTPEQLASMRRAGLVVADALAAVAEAAAPGVTTAELDEVARGVIFGAGATSNFLGYHGFPAVICASVNDEVVHGIPGHRRLAPGDLLSVDCGAVVDGWHGDAAITVAIGEVSQQAADLSEATRRALWDGIAAVRPGARLTDIGAACEAAIGGRYGMVIDYVGHGIGTAMHMEPSVPHIGPAGKGPTLRAGMALAIEPMVTVGSSEVAVLADEWTVVTCDGTLAAHWEHSVAITPTGPFVLTAPDGGAAELAARGITLGRIEGPWR